MPPELQLAYGSQVFPSSPADGSRQHHDADLVDGHERRLRSQPHWPVGDVISIHMEMKLDWEAGVYRPEGFPVLALPYVLMLRCIVGRWSPRARLPKR